VKPGEEDEGGREEGEEEEDEGCISRARSSRRGRSQRGRRRMVPALSAAFCMNCSHTSRMSPVCVCVCVMSGEGEEDKRNYWESHENSKASFILTVLPSFCFLSFSLSPPSFPPSIICLFTCDEVSHLVGGHEET